MFAFNSEFGRDISWSSFAWFVYHLSLWFARGATCDHGSSSGFFSLGSTHGYVSFYDGFRVITKIN